MHPLKRDNHFIGYSSYFSLYPSNYFSTQDFKISQPIALISRPDWLRQSSARYGFCRTKSHLVRGTSPNTLYAADSSGIDTDSSFLDIIQGADNSF